MLAPGGGDAQGAVLHGDAMPAEEGLGDREEAVGDGVAVEILDDDQATGDAVHFGEDAGAIGVGEVVEKQRAVGDVAGLIA